MDYQKYSNSIFIVKDSAKKSLIKDIGKSHSLLNIKIITLSEFKKNYFFDYSNETIYEVSKKCNVISEIAKIYIENMYYLNNIKEEKVTFLYELKAFLDSNKKLKYNGLFKKYLNNKRIVLVDLEDVDKFYENIFKALESKNDVIRISTLKFNSKKKLIKASNKNEEIAAVASSIVSLIKQGVDINKIKLANVQADYIVTIKNTFNSFNIPIILPEESIVGSTIASKFIELYQKNLSATLDMLKDYIESNQDKKIYESIIKVVNKYVWCDDFETVKEQIIRDVNKIKLNENEYKNAVRIIDFENDFLGDDYIFLINFNLGIIPVCAKDEDYFSNSIKNRLNISDSNEINRKRILNVQNRIKHTKNLVVSYREADLNGKLYISSAYDESLFDEVQAEYNYNLSNTYNKRLLASKLDDFYKYGIVGDMLPILRYNYADMPYLSFNNEYNGIDKEKLYGYLDSKLTLSYSSIDTYYKCAFRYYLEYILNLDEFETKFETIIGNIFHKVLSKCYNQDFDFDSAYEKACSEEEYPYDERDKHFLIRLKEELKQIIDILYLQEDYTFLKNKLFEKKIVVLIDEKHNVIFKGFIDKIIYNEFNGEKIATIIDYKTGDASINLTNIQNGLSLQLPSYAYLLKHSPEFNKSVIGGFYLQRLFDNENIKLSGYTNSDINVMEKVDKTYLNSKLINGLRFGQNGLYKNAKVLSSKEIDDLCDLVEVKIVEAAKCILDADFKINPKEINNRNLGCQFCKFKSICYMKNKDIVKLGGEINAEVD